MSMKIWEAYRVKKPSDLWPVLRKIKKQGEENVKQAMETFWRELIDNVREDTDNFKEQLEKDKGDREFAKLHIVEKLLRNAFKEQATALDRSPFDIDVSVSVFELDGQFYMRPFCDRVSCLRGSLDFMKEMPELEDYHYQNSTDQPDNVSDEEWNERCKVWDRIYGDSGFANCQVILELCSYSLFCNKYYTYVDLFRELVLSRKERAEKILA